jgi:hypothetical protein
MKQNPKVSFRVLFMFYARVHVYINMEVKLYFAGINS